MHTTPQRKLLIAVLALGGVAIGVDRLILQGDAGPAQAAADLIPTALESKVGKSPSDAKPRPGRISASPAPERAAVRLAALARSSVHTDPSPNAFAPPADWLERIVPASPAAAVREEPTADHGVGSPTFPAFRLTMVSRHAGAAVTAVINGTPLGLGESIDGYRLTGLSASEPAGRGNRPGRPPTATLEGPAGVIELTLDPLPVGRGAGRD